MDLQIMKQIVAELYIPMITDEHGDEGATALRSIWKALDQLYRYIAPESCKGRIIVFKAIDAADRPIADAAVQIESPQYLAQESWLHLVIQVLDDGPWLVWKDITPDPVALSQNAVVYLWEADTERFFAKAKSRIVPNPEPSYASAFAIPTFKNLHDALEEYKAKAVRYSTCMILSQAWHDADRLFLKNAQEETMRRSLTQALRYLLRGDVEVRPEQNVDESKPVDIKVTWEFSNRRALIEIKWLGKARDVSTGKVVKTYTASRARDGADQLADYLDRNVVQAPLQITRGYLVVFDARRHGLTEASTHVDTKNGTHYRDAEIEYDPKHHETRDDFDPPIRMFIEPVCR